MNALVRTTKIAAAIFGVLLLWPVALAIGLFWLVAAWATK